MSEHTPIPWRWYEGALLGPDDRGKGFEDCILRTLGNCGPEEADEQFIVRAVNSHAALLAALTKCIAVLALFPDVGYDACDPSVRRVAGLAIQEGDAAIEDAGKE